MLIYFKTKTRGKISNDLQKIKFKLYLKSLKLEFNRPLRIYLNYNTFLNDI